MAIPNIGIVSTDIVSRLTMVQTKSRELKGEEGVAIMFGKRKNSPFLQGMKIPIKGNGWLAGLELVLVQAGR